MRRQSPSRSPWQIMAPVRGRIRLAMALAIASAACGLAALAWLASALHALFVTPGTWPWAPMAGAAVATVLAYVLRQAAFDQSHYAAFRLETTLRTQLAAHLTAISLGEVQRLGASTLAKVMHDDVKALHVFVADSTPLQARAYAMPVLTLLAMCWLDWRLALGAVAVLAFGFGVLSLAMRNRTEMTRRYNEARERVSAAVVAFVQAMPVVRTFDTGHASFGRYQQALDQYLDMLTGWYRDASFTSRFSLAVLNPLPTLVVLLWLGAWLTWHDALPTGVWLAALLLGTGMAEAMMPMMMLNHMVEKAQASVARIQEVLDVAPQPVAAASHTPRDASVEFVDVAFRYLDDAPLALDDISFTALPGTVTALVGASGAGKSTVARLACRFWDATRGRVCIGGIDVRDMSPDTLMSQVALVDQDPFLFAASIADNIRQGMPEATMQDIVAACRTAQIHDFIVSLPAGYDTLVGERGISLSGGQRQRITIARTILQNRPILVLDEATAFSDPENEAALMQALSALMHGKTVLIVAHRLSTIRHADQILVFDRGRLAERGPHGVLLERGGIYARMWADHEAARAWTLRATDKEQA